MNISKKLLRILRDKQILTSNEHHNDVVFDIIERIYGDRDITRIFVTGIRRRDRENLVNTAEYTKPERYAYNRYRKSLLEGMRLRVNVVVDEILAYVIRRNECHQDFDRFNRTHMRLKLIEMTYRMRKKAYNDHQKSSHQISA